MSDVNIYISAEELQAFGIQLGRLRHKTPAVVARAANKAAIKARTDIDKETTDRYLTKKAAVRKTSTLHRATYATMTARLVYTDGFRNLTRWSGRPGGNAVRPMKAHQRFDKNPRNYFAHVMKKNGHKALAGGGEIPFIQIPKNGVMLLFRRTGRSRYPIKGVAAPAIPQIVKNRETMQAVGVKAFDVMSKEAARQIALYLSGKIT